MNWSESDSVRRLRAVLARYVGVIAVALVLLALLGGFLTYTAYGQDQTRTERTTNTLTAWSSTGQFTHEATVRNGTRAFPKGTVLENRTVYYRQIAPVLNGSFVYRYTASDNGSLSAEASVALVIRSVADDSDDGTTEYWRVEDSLSNASATLAPDEALRVSFSQNVTGIQQQVERIEAELGRTPGTVQTRFVARVDVDGTRNGRAVDDRRTYRLPVTVGGNVYRLNDSGPRTVSGERTTRDRTEVPVKAGPLWRYGGPLLTLVGLLGLVGLVAGRYTGRLEVTEAEREYLAYRSERAEFDEWITEARLPTDRIANADTHVETTSLSGLVDLAIDSDRRVLQAADHERYYVLDGDACYTFEPPTPETDDDPLAASERTGTPAPEESQDGEDADGDLSEPFDQLLDGVSEREDRTNED